MSTKHVTNISMSEAPHLSPSNIDAINQIFIGNDKQNRNQGIPICAEIPSMIEVNNLSDSELLDLAKALQVLDERYKYNLQEFLFPKYLSTPLYKKHLLFFKAGAVYKERALIAGNRTGKTWSAETEVSYHAKRALSL